VADKLVNMERWWNYNDRERPTYSEKNLLPSYFVRDKSHIDWLRVKSVPRGDGQEIANQWQ